ncbi:SERTA domain-containing protein 2 [Cricetulus griseus]|uniref:SERTA domain-containing protein 2 n=1 Tax=Cricetulus griseus TaxID=10029 RepID=G3HT62_CRIGR|nr:SERTA domain-containing protein 2 [Cricetulus griseus]
MKLSYQACTLQAAPPAAPTRLSYAALPPEKDIFSSALDDIEELCPTSTSTEAAMATSAVPDSPKGTSSESSIQKPKGPQEGRTDDSLPGNFEITTSTGFLTDLTLDDILFADIDTSMYDFDPCASTSGTVSKMAPVSADELLKTLAPTAVSLLPQVCLSKWISQARPHHGGACWILGTP